MTDLTTVVGADWLLSITKRRLALIIDFVIVAVICGVPLALTNQVSTSPDSIGLTGYVFVIAAWMLPALAVRLYGRSLGFLAVGGEVIHVLPNAIKRPGIIRTFCWFYISTVSFLVGLALAKLSFGKVGINFDDVPKTDLFFSIRVVNLSQKGMIRSDQPALSTETVRQGVTQ